MKKTLTILLVLCTLLSSCGPKTATSDNTTQSRTDSSAPNTEITTSQSTTSQIHPGTQTGTQTNTPPIEPDPPVPAYDLVITEVMPDNTDFVLGNELDWIEIYNREETSVSLDNYYLTDSLEKPYDLPLTGMTVPSEGYLVVTLDEEAAFHLSSSGETVYLTRNGEVISELTFGEATDGESFSPEGACRWATPGFANTEEGYLSYLDTVELPDLIISEALSSNQTYLPQKGECYDLIEIKNISGEPIDLSGYTLTDKRKEPDRFAFPDVVLGPGEFYVIFCSGDTSLGSNHTSFKISSSGETVYLAKDGVITDLLKIPSDLKANESYGRDGNRSVYLLSPTPGEENTVGYLNGVSAPAASHPSGLYDEALTVTLSGAGTIYYTLDGSRPTLDSPVYEGPLSISGVTTIRTFCVDGERSSALTAFTYVIGTEHDLPVVTVAIPSDSLTGDMGVLNHVDKDYEYEAVLTLIENGEEKFSVPFGFRLHGNDSRNGKKQNFQLRFRSEYGAGKLKYALFDDRDFAEYNSLLLKGGSEDWLRSIMRDEICTAVVDGNTALYAQAIKPCVLYLGGEYWGVYYLRERFDDDYVANHLGVSVESVDLIDAYGSVKSGSIKEYNSLLTYVKNHDMSKPENYAYLCEQVDIYSLMDWYICRSYMGDKDVANIRYFQSSEHDGKWRWMYFDLDWAFYHTTDDPLSIIKDNGRHVLILGALASEEGQDAFLRRYAELMSTVLNETYIIGVIDSLASTIESEMERDRTKWGYTLAKWNSAVDSLRNYVKDGARDKNVLSHLQSYFDLSDSEMEAYFG